MKHKLEQYLKESCRWNSDGQLSIKYFPNYMLKSYLTLMLLVSNLTNAKRCKKSWKMTETLARGYSSESRQQELPNEYQLDRV